MAKRPKAPKEFEVDGPDPEKFIAPSIPKPMSALIGQDRAVRIFNDALKSDRIHHAWIFHGPQGVGKFTAALSFAALLLDPSTQATFSGEFEADPSSQTQTLLKAGTHPDLHVIVKELALFSEEPEVRGKKLTNIPVDVLREFMIEPGSRASVVRTASRARKVFIVDEAELMASASQNALLKMLEEPAQGVIIILITSAEESLLATIRSRAQRVYFKPLSQVEMHTYLKARALEISPEAEKFLIEFSQGSPGAFTAAHEGGLYAWWQRIGAMLVGCEKGQYNFEFGAAMHELVDTYAKSAVENGNKNASKESANHEAAAWMFKLVGSYIARRMHAVSRGPQGASAVRPYLTMLDKLREAEAEYEANVNGQIVMEKLAAELATQ